MCGIGGVFNYRSGRPTESTVLISLANRLIHRGPDGDGIYLRGSVGLVHRRLAIIDLATGHQPMTSSCGRYVIVFNGEIYNYLEIFEELAGRGQFPRTKSDTEAILMAYAEWGLDLFPKLNGMFAFALWDTVERRLVLARDRMGEKPLYFAENEDGLVFASEIKALSTLSGLHLELDLTSVQEFIHLGYVPNPGSILAGAHKLEPGHFLVVEDGREPVDRAFWSLAFEPDEAPTEAQWEEELRALFDDSVRLRLRSDVPLGVLLSGGVDSAAILTTMKRVTNLAGIKTYCIGVDVPGSTTEFAPARELAESLGTDHVEIRLDEREFGETLLSATQVIDEPVAEPMMGQLHALCRRVKEDVTVVLSGEGSDETWFGYTPYRTMFALDLMHRSIPSAALRRVRGWLNGLDLHEPRLKNAARKAAHFAGLAELPLELRYLGLNHFDSGLKKSLFLPDVRDALRGKDPRRRLLDRYRATRHNDPITRMAALDCTAWLVDNTLSRSDVISMASALELRLPFLDHRLVELATRVPSRYKVRIDDQKVILKNALKDRIPEATRRRKKVGFPTPLLQLFDGKWGDEARDVLLSPCPATAHLFDKSLIERMFAETRSRERNLSRTLFQLYVFEHWARRVYSDTGPSSWRAANSMLPPPRAE